MASRADRQSEGWPEVIEVGVAGVAGQDSAGDLLEAGAARAPGEITVGSAGHGRLTGCVGLHLPGRGPEDLQHGHAAGGGVPHSGGDRAAGTRLFSHPGSDFGTGIAVAAGGGEPRGGVDRGDVTRAEAAGRFSGEAARPAADIEDPHAGLSGTLRPVPVRA
jgi:hypothetical protein